MCLPELLDSLVLYFSFWGFGLHLGFPYALRHNFFTWDFGLRSGFWALLGLPLGFWVPLEIMGSGEAFDIWTSLGYFGTLGLWGFGLINLTWLLGILVFVWYSVFVEYKIRIRYSFLEYRIPNIENQNEYRIPNIESPNEYRIPNIKNLNEYRIPNMKIKTNTEYNFWKKNTTTEYIFVFGIRPNMVFALEYRYSPVLGYYDFYFSLKHYKKKFSGFAGTPLLRGGVIITQEKVTESGVADEWGEDFANGNLIFREDYQKSFKKKSIDTGICRRFWKRNNLVYFFLFPIMNSLCML